MNVSSNGQFPTPSELRSVPLPERLPGTRVLELDKEEGIDRDYANKALAAQEAGMGVFRYLPDAKREKAEAVFDSKPSSDEAKLQKLRILNGYRQENMANSADFTAN